MGGEELQGKTRIVGAHPHPQPARAPCPRRLAPLQAKGSLRAAPPPSSRKGPIRAHCSAASKSAGCKPIAARLARLLGSKGDLPKDLLAETPGGGQTPKGWAVFEARLGKAVVEGLERRPDLPRPEARPRGARERRKFGSRADRARGSSRERLQPRRSASGSRSPTRRPRPKQRATPAGQPPLPRPRPGALAGSAPRLPGPQPGRRPQKQARRKPWRAGARSLRRRGRPAMGATGARCARSGSARPPRGPRPQRRVGGVRLPTGRSHRVQRSRPQGRASSACSGRDRWAGRPVLPRCPEKGIPLDPDPGDMGGSKRAGESTRPPFVTAQAAQGRRALRRPSRAASIVSSRAKPRTGWGPTSIKVRRPAPSSERTTGSRRTGSRRLRIPVTRTELGGVDPLAGKRGVEGNLAAAGRQAQSPRAALLQAHRSGPSGRRSRRRSAWRGCPRDRSWSGAPRAPRARRRRRARRDR